MLPETGSKGNLTHQITISAVDPIVTVLPTKTKPKKLSLVGSDGKRYANFFKDEQIYIFFA